MINYKLALQITIIFSNANISHAPTEMHKDICVHSTRVISVSKSVRSDLLNGPEGVPGDWGDRGRGWLLAPS